MAISRKYANLIFTFLTALFMSFLMSLVVTYINLGLVSDFISKWLRAFGFSFIISYPAASIVIPTVRRMVNRMTR